MPATHPACCPTSSVQKAGEPSQYCTRVWNKRTVAAKVVKLLLSSAMLQPQQQQHFHVQHAADVLSAACLPVLLSRRKARLPSAASLTALGSACSLAYHLLHARQHVGLAGSLADSHMLHVGWHSRVACSLPHNKQHA